MQPDTDFKLGDIVRMPHPAGGHTVAARIVAFRSTQLDPKQPFDEVRVESAGLQNWTAWWPIKDLEIYEPR